MTGPEYVDFRMRRAFSVRIGRHPHRPYRPGKFKRWKPGRAPWAAPSPHLWKPFKHMRPEARF
jgi:hypothetical protein